VFLAGTDLVLRTSSGSVLIGLLYHHSASASQGMIGCVVPPLCKCKPGRPFLRFRERHASKIIFQTLIYTLGLPASLWVMSRAKIQLYFHSVEQSFPEITCENCVSVRNNHI
jgi:hypothetical protein